MEATTSSQLLQLSTPVLQLDSTTSALIQQIANHLQQSQNTEINWVKEIVIQALASFLAIITALFLLWVKEPIVRRISQTKIVPLKITKHHQNKELIMYRLILLNDSNYVAKNVEVDIKEVIEPDGSPRVNFVQSPLSWTHRNQEPRDIFPHQDAWLDLFNVTLTQGKFIRICAPNISDLPDLPYIKAGKTKITLNYYQENGRNGTINLSVEWNGVEDNFEEANLPKVEIT